VYLARVIGTVVASTKAEGLLGVKLLIVQPLDANRAPAGEPHVAADATQAGEGDLVSCVGSREAGGGEAPTKKKKSALGTVVMTVKHPAFDGEKLLVVQPLDERGAPQGASFLAIDRAQAGEGDLVLVMREGSGVRQIVGRDRGLSVEEAVKIDHPVRSLIVGIVDQVTGASEQGELALDADGRAS
jgi:ethanolamine utilization protein EutN